MLCAEQVNLLCQIAEAAMREMEVLHFMSLGSSALASMLRPKSCFQHPILFCDISRDGWAVMFANDSWADAAGASMPPSPLETPQNPICPIVLGLSSSAMSNHMPGQAFITPPSSVTSPGTAGPSCIHMYTSDS